MPTSLGTDLRTLLGSSLVETDPEVLQAYANDATHYYKRSLPDAVVLPVKTEDVAKVMRYAAQQQIPVTPRGAGSGLAGGCTPVAGGIVLDMKRMNQILGIDRRNLTATVEAGLVLARLQKQVEKAGLFYPPDPQSMKVCTLGGNIATRAGGPRGVKYGTTSSYVLGLEAVMPDGSIVKTGGKFVKQSSGYDLTHLLTGSEGTLAVITQAHLRLLSLPEYRQTMAVSCTTLDQAAEMVAEILARGLVPAMLELLMKLAVQVMNNYITPPLGLDAGGYLLMEFDGDVQQVKREIDQVRSLCLDMGALEVRVVENEAEAASYWEARSNLYSMIMTIFKRAISEDLTVPRYLIPELVRAVQETAASVGIGIGIAGHAGDGNMHPTILQHEFSTEVDEKSVQAIEMIIRRGLELGGTLSGEHGIGIHKAPYLHWEHSQEEIDLMRRIKQAFDPQGIMNPGKIWTEGGAASV